MLISRRREGETIQIGEGVEIRIVTIRKNKVIVGIIAPREVKISTGKLTDEAMANTMAAINSVNVKHLLPTSTEQPASQEECVVSLLKIKGPIAEQEPAPDDKTYGNPE